MYTIRKLEDKKDAAAIRFMIKSGSSLVKLHGSKHNYLNFDFGHYMKTGRIMLCYKGDEVVGMMLSRIYGSLFDPKIKILRQDLLYTLYPKATALLLQEFIDFGKSNADHIITMIGSKTNIKPESMKKLGFKEFEKLYRIEV